MNADLLPWIIAAPLAGAGLLFGWRGAPARIVRLIGVASVFLAAGLSAVVTWQYDGEPVRRMLWLWFEVEQLRVPIALYLDGLALNMLWVITGVGSLIHLYAGWYMRGDEGYRRFFAYMNLFVAAMLLLVLGDNLLTLFFGWEVVGLCSYLLIGFWYHDAANCYAARKAFVVTRVGDALLVIGLFLLLRELGTLDIQDGVARAQAAWAVGSPLATATCLLLLGGAVGKSAQLPLQTWLPDAMAGPTPVSALIHAATMVTAGVYLIARMHGLFELSPVALAAVGWIGAVTLLLAGGAALVQRDIKRILAYSTMSQIGYMFLALGASAWSAAIFHLMTHAFFKALLFMTAGSIILALHHEQDIFRMGGLRRRLPLAFACFVGGSAALAALPWVTAGYYSKDAILFALWDGGHQWWWLMGVAGAFLTSVYIFRAVFIVFAGEPRGEVQRDADWTEQTPLLILLLLSLIGGGLWLPAADSLPATPVQHPWPVLTVQIALPLAGIVLAWWLYARSAQSAPKLSGGRRLMYAAWGFDALYARLFERPWMALASINRADMIDSVYTALVSLIRYGHTTVIRSQTGQLRWYATGLALGLVALVGVAVWI